MRKVKLCRGTQLVMCVVSSRSCVLYLLKVKVISIGIGIILFKYNINNLKQSNLPLSSSIHKYSSTMQNITTYLHQNRNTNMYVHNIVALLCNLQVIVKAEKLY